MGCPLGVKLGVLATRRPDIATPFTFTARTFVMWSWLPSWIVAERAGSAVFGGNIVPLVGVRARGYAEGKLSGIG